MPAEKVFVITGEEVSVENSNHTKTGVRVRSLLVLRNEYWNGLHVLGILCACNLAISILTLIPRHNSIIDQTYWFEIIIPAGFWIILWTAMMIQDLMIFSGMRSTTLFPFFLKLTLVSLTTLVASACMFHVFWTIILEYNHPMPLLGFPWTLITLFVSLVSIPFLSQHDAVAEKIGRRKLKNFTLYGIVWTVNFAVQRPFLTKTFATLGKTNAQFIMALIIPVSKVTTKLLLSKMIDRIIENRNERVNVALTITVNYFYGLFVVK